MGPYLPIIDHELERKVIHFTESEGYISPPFPLFTEGYPFGSDKDGRDLLSLIVIGTRNTMWTVLLIVLLRYTVAIPLTLIASLGSRNPISWFITKWSDSFSFLPTLFIAIVYLHLPFVHESEERFLWGIFGLALIEIGRLSQFFQEQITALSKKEYVESGIMIGNTKMGLLFRYYWPALRPYLIVNFMQDIGKVMLLLGPLGFLQIFLVEGFIVVSYATTYLNYELINLPELLGYNKWHIITHPFLPLTIGFAISFIILTFYWLGEGLRKYYEERNSSFRRSRSSVWKGMILVRKGEDVT